MHTLASFGRIRFVVSKTVCLFVLLGIFGTGAANAQESPTIKRWKKSFRGKDVGAMLQVLKQIAKTKDTDTEASDIAAIGLVSKYGDVRKEAADILKNRPNTTEKMIRNAAKSLKDRRTLPPKKKKEDRFRPNYDNFLRLRINCLQIIQNGGSRSIIVESAVAGRLKSENIEEQFEAAKALGDMGSKSRKLVKFLQKQLKSTNQENRNQACLRFWSIIDLVPKYTDTIAKIAFDDRETIEIRSSAIQTLRRAGAAAHTYLPQLLKVAKSTKYKDTADSSIAAIATIAQPGDVEALGYLKSRLPTLPSNGRGRAIFSYEECVALRGVSRLDRKQMLQKVDLILYAISNSQGSSTGWAIAALGELDSNIADVVLGLTDLLDASKTQPTRQALWALRKLGPKALAAEINIEKMLQSKYIDVVVDAKKALGSIKKQPNKPKKP